MSTHKPPSIKECIERKFSKALHRHLRKSPDYLKSHPEMKLSAIDAFINSRGYLVIIDNIEPGITATDLMRLLDLVERGVFILDEIKDKIPKNNFRIMITMESVLPGWTNSAEIISVLNPFDIRVLRRVLFYTDDLIKILSQQTHKHISDIQATANILNNGEIRLLEQINNTPGLRKAFEEFLKITEVHEL
jgi:hypothetical protein